MTDTRPAARQRQRRHGWADDRIPSGYVNKETAADLLGVSTTTIDRWSRQQTDSWPHPQLLIRYQHHGYPYTLFRTEELLALNEG